MKPAGKLLFNSFKVHNELFFILKRKYFDKVPFQVRQSDRIADRWWTKFNILESQLRQVSSNAIKQKLPVIPCRKKNFADLRKKKVKNVKERLTSRGIVVDNSLFSRRRALQMCFVVDDDDDEKSGGSMVEKREEIGFCYIYIYYY